ncbi:MAG: sodium/glutamate symporter [Myxococcota bacterium]
MRDVLTDFGIMSMIIVASHLLRYKIRFLQYTYMPSAILAGVICLVGGWQFLDIIPFSVTDNGNPRMVSYPCYLVVLLFSTLFLGKRKRKMSLRQTIEHAGDTFFFNLASLTGQYGFALLFGLVVMRFIYPTLPAGFAIFLPAGFIGGHGTAAAVGGFLEEAGSLEGAQTIGYAMATLGILAGVFGGMLIINIATRMGWTRVVKSIQDMPMSMQTGFLPENERTSMGQATVSPIALDPLTWHVAIVIATTVLAFELSDWLRFHIPGVFSSIPVFCLALLVGTLIQKVFNFFRIGRYVDQEVIQRIGSWVTDYLIAFGIASITLGVVMKYALPLLTLFCFGCLLTVSMLWFLGRRMCRTFWFERSILMYGWNTGSVSTSILLLRVIDPQTRSQVLEDFGLAYLGIALVEIAIIALVPPLVLNGMIVAPTVILLSVFVACLICSRLFVGWSYEPPNAVRGDELEVLEQQSETP